MDPTEQRVVDTIEARRDELVALVGDLIAFDTTARHVGDPPRAEADLQAYLGDRLGSRGASVDVWEPSPDDVADNRQVEAGLDFAGRPQLAATFAGAGGGRSLLLNGHIDVVTPEPVDRWTSDPWRADVRDGNLYGRGACDMKGGVGCMVFAAEVLAELGVRLAGDVVVCTVTDEESSGAGGIAAVRHGVRADAGIVTEPTAFDVWVACRGSPDARHHGRGPPGARRDAPAALAGRRRRQRDREDGRRARRGRPPARRLARPSGQAASATSRPARSSPSSSTAASGR